MGVVNMKLEGFRSNPYTCSKLLSKRRWLTWVVSVEQKFFLRQKGYFLSKKYSHRFGQEYCAVSCFPWFLDRFCFVGKPLVNFYDIEGK